MDETSIIGTDKTFLSIHGGRASALHCGTEALPPDREK